MTALRNYALRILALCACLSAVAATPPVAAQQTVSLGTSTQGGGFELFGRNVAEVINAQDATLHVQALASKGSKQNLADLAQGNIDIGLVEGNAARDALEGAGSPTTQLKVLTVMYPNPGMFVVRARSPYQRIEDLKQKLVAFGTRASGLRILARDILDGIGLDPETDFQSVILDKAAQGPDLVLSQEVEALWGAGIGWPGFVKVADSEEGARFIAPSAAQIEQIRAKHPHLKPMTVPAGTYTGQTEPIHSLGLWSLILVRADVSEPLVYRLAKALHGGEAQLAARLPQGSFTTAQNTAKHVDAAQLHPGVARFYREVGLLP